MKLIFLDTETTGLDIDVHEVWEVGYIVRDTESLEQGTPLPAEDEEKHWFLPLTNFALADPFALAIGRFWERYEYQQPLAEVDEFLYKWCQDWVRESKDAFIVGACVDFDVYRLDRLCRRYGTRMFHNYHLVDVENLCAGHLHMPPPWKSEMIYEKLGYIVKEEDKHTALGDARACRDIYDLIMAESGR